MQIGRFQKVSIDQFNKDTNNNNNTIYEDIILPKRATTGSAGYDFVCPFNITIKPGQNIKIPTGIRCQMEEGYVLNIYPRSSFGIKHQMFLSNTVGIIDSDYYYANNQGHIIISIINMGEHDIIINKGERFVQGIFLKFYTVQEEEINSSRHGGFGSTGK